jgi:hypothetical protein
MVKKKEKIVSRAVSVKVPKIKKIVAAKQLKIGRAKSSKIA